MRRGARPSAGGGGGGRRGQRPAEGHDQSAAPDPADQRMTEEPHDQASVLVAFADRNIGVAKQANADPAWVVRVRLTG